MTTYVQKDHILLHDTAHSYALLPEEYAGYVRAVEDHGIDVVMVTIPDWPPAPYSRPAAWIVLGGAMWWESRAWTGEQPAVARTLQNENSLHDLAREIEGSATDPKRVAYVWNAEVYDASKHILLRNWLNENELDIVAFLSVYLPSIDGDQYLVDVTNPTLQEDIKRRGGYEPVKRAVNVEHRWVLANFANQFQTFEDEYVQYVSWRRSLDDTRWEARRQDLPQRTTWASTRSFIQRAIGQGAWTESDRNEDGYAFGPFMELWDDGTLHVWVVERAIAKLAEQPLIINGVPITLTPEVGTMIFRLVGQVTQDEVAQIVGKQNTRVEDAVLPDQFLAIAEWKDNSPFYLAASLLPAWISRQGDRPALVVRLSDTRAEIRLWGAKPPSGFVLNTVTVPDFQAWNGGWRARLSLADGKRIIGAVEERESVPIEETVVPEVVTITSGLRVYSPTAVVQALATTFGQEPRIFGRSTSDTAFVALTRQGVAEYLKENLVNQRQYVNDDGNRNFDCENFAEQLRTGLQTKYGINGVGVVWGDGHAWSFFVIVGTDSVPEILMVEPQTDAIVTSLSGMYSVIRRCEVLL